MIVEKYVYVILQCHTQFVMSKIMTQGEYDVAAQQKEGLGRWRSFRSYCKYPLTALNSGCQES